MTARVRDVLRPLVCAALLATAAPGDCVSGEIGGMAGADPSPGRDAVGIAIGFPQLVAAQWDHPISLTLDLSLHAGGLIWLASAGGRLRWRAPGEGWRPYVFAGSALLAIITMTDDDDTSFIGLWGGCGLEFVRPQWKIALEGGVLAAAENTAPSVALIYSLRL